MKWHSNCNHWQQQVWRCKSLQYRHQRRTGCYFLKIIVAMSALRRSNTPIVRRRLCCADSVPLRYQQIRCKGYRSTDLPVWQHRLSAQLSLMVLHADDAFVFGQANCVFRSNRSNDVTAGASVDASDCANPCFAWFATLIVASIFDSLIQISSNEHERQRMRVSVERSETDWTRYC